MCILETDIFNGINSKFIRHLSQTILRIFKMTEIDTKNIDVKKMRQDTEVKFLLEEANEIWQPHILSSLIIVNHLKSITILEYAAMHVQMLMMPSNYF